VCLHVDALEVQTDAGVCPTKECAKLLAVSITLAATVGHRPASRLLAIDFHSLIAVASCATMGKGRSLVSYVVGCFVSSLMRAKSSFATPEKLRLLDF
jgi:hypothetical protein